MIISSILHWARKKPQRTALELDQQQISYYEFARYILSVRSVLLAHPLRPEMTVAVIAQSHIWAWIILMACKTLGLNTLVVGAGRENFLRAFSRFDFIIRVSGDPCSANASSLGYPVIDIDPTSIFSIGNSIKTIPSDIESISNAGGVIKLTSGTTEAPKKILFRTQRDMDRLGSQVGSRKISANPAIFALDYALHSGSGYNVGCYAWLKGGKVILAGANGWLHDFYRKSFNHTFLRPSHVDKIIQVYGSAGGFNSRGLTLFISGGFFSARKVSWLKEHITKTVYQDYASTETGKQFSTLLNTPDDLRWHLPIKGHEFVITDESGKDVASGQSGKIGFKMDPDALADCYFDTPADQFPLFLNNYFYPGDIAVQRSDGRVRFLGRDSDTVLLQEIIIPSRYIEDDLEAKLNCTNVVVFSHQNDADDDEVVVIFESRDQLTSDQRQYVRDRFSNITSCRIIFLEKFAQTLGGKTDRKNVISVAKAMLAGSLLQK